MNYIKNNKGSTLLMVVIVIAILSALSTAVVAMTIMNLKMKSVDTKVQKSFYYAEAGLDQVYINLATLSEKALGQAYISTNSEINTILTSTRSALYSKEIAVADGSGSESSTTTISAISSELIQQEANRLFKEYFRTNFNTLAKNGSAAYETSFIPLLRNSYDLAISSTEAPTTGSAIMIEIDNGSVIGFANEGSKFTINNVRVKFNLNNQLTKQITTNIDIIEPNFDFPLNFTEDVVTARDNPLWQYALLSGEGNIFFNSNSAIDGNIYAKGTNNFASLVPADNKGIIFNAGTDLNGNAITNGYVKFNSSAITTNFENGSIYCNSFFIPDTVSGVNVNGDHINVYTYDDLELNGLNSKMNINGVYYGYSDGGSVSGAGKHNMSSSIIINAPDITAPTTGNHSELAISGDNGDSNNIEKFNYTGVDTPLGNYVAGTSYIEPVTATTEYYQTGESMSIKENYIAYIMPPEGDTFDSSPVYSEVLSIFKNIDGLDYLENVNGSFPLTLNAKIQILQKYHAKNAGVVKLGNVDILEPNVSYALGNMIYKNGANISIGNKNILTLSPAVRGLYFEADHNYLLNRLKNRKVTGMVNTDTSCTNSNLADVITYYGNGAIPNLGKIEAADMAINQYEVLYSSNDASKTVVITNDINRVAAANEVVLTNGKNTIVGLVVTAGNVRIEGSTYVFKGSIIARGDIIISGSGTKTFINRPDIYLEFFKAMRLGYEMDNYFKKSNSDDANFNAVDSTYKYKSIMSDIPRIDTSGTRLSNIERQYSEVIKFDNWTITE